MGLDLSSYEAFKKQAQSSVSGNSSTGSSGGTTSSNPIGGDTGAANSYSEVSLFANEENQEKKASDTYQELFDKVMYGEEEETTATEATTKNSNEEKKADKKTSNGTVDDYEKNEVAGGNAQETKDAINALLESDLFKNQGIKDGASHIKNDVINNDQWKVDMDVDGDGVIDQGVSLADAIAGSFDSELDLYIEKQVQDIMAKYECYDFKALFGSENSQAIKDLAALGIRADAVGDDAEWQNRTYSFSLVEVPEGFEKLSPEEQMEIVYADDAKILEDGNGKKGSMIFADCLVPDGMAQGAEMNLSSILDTMGYDCISKADFVGREEEYHQLMEEIGADLSNGEYTSDGTTHADIYTEKTLKIWVATRARDTANGDAPGQWSQHLTYEDTMARIEKFGLGAEGGSLRKTGSLSTNNSPMTEGDATGTEKQLQEEAEAAAQEEKEIESKASDILNKLVSKYETEHGEKPVGEDLAKLELQAEQQAKTAA
ncbi:MAG: hypothetical protein IJY61_08000 [Candidatus Gastranaerophilales bacterium]|nr:hypothetical protein [Candidatus Gastranaerophilales bacterium]